MKVTTKPKGFGIAAAVLLVAMSFAPGITSAYEEPKDHWERDNSCYNYWGNGYIAGSVGYFGASWIPERNVWEYNFRITGVGEGRDDYGDPLEVCLSHRVIVKETVNKEHQTIWTSTDKQYMGAWPNSGTEEEYYDIAYSVTSLAISAINSHASFALSAIGLLESFTSDCDDEQNGEKVYRNWDCSSPETDVGHWFWWLHDVDPNQEVEFTVEDDLFGGGFEWVGVSWSFTCNTPSPPSKMSAAEMRNYGIEVIPISELKGRADELNMAPKTVEELLKQREPIYYAHNLPVYSTTPH
jgi:hypothetical protein